MHSDNFWGGGGFCQDQMAKYPSHWKWGGIVDTFVSRLSQAVSRTCDIQLPWWSHALLLPAGIQGTLSSGTSLAQAQAGIAVEWKELSALGEMRERWLNLTTKLAGIILGMRNHRIGSERTDQIFFPSGDLQFEALENPAGFQHYTRCFGSKSCT